MLRNQLELLREAIIDKNEDNAMDPDSSNVCLTFVRTGLGDA